MKSFDKESFIEFLSLALKRALWTFSEVALSMIVLGMPFSTIDWKGIFDVALTASIVSILKSIVVSMPEYKHDGELTISENACNVRLGIDENTVNSKKSIRLKVVPDTNQK